MIGATNLSPERLAPVPVDQSPTRVGRTQTQLARCLARSTRLAVVTATGPIRVPPNRADSRWLRALALRDAARELCDIHGLEVEISGSIPRGACVVVSNHLSYIDPVVLASLFPCQPIAKRELAGWPIVGAGAKNLGALFVRRDCAFSGAIALRQALSALEAGVSVLNFPEGTTSDGREVLPFRRGIFGIAAYARRPVVPVHLSFRESEMAWTGEDWFLPHYLRFASRTRTRAIVRIGEPELPRGGMTATELARRARAAIMELKGSSP